MGRTISASLYCCCARRVVAQQTSISEKVNFALVVCTPVKSDGSAAYFTAHRALVSYLRVIWLLKCLLERQAIPKIGFAVRLCLHASAFA